MPLFFINFRRDDQISKDDVGIDLPSLKEAREAALVSAPEILADTVKSGAKDPIQAVMITDESGQELMTIPAKDVLPEPLKR
jgi:uncharacterized protein DUF6894